jgi:hypothetical protein
MWGVCLLDLRKVSGCQTLLEKGDTAIGSSWPILLISEIWF